MNKREYEVPEWATGMVLTDGAFGYFTGKLNGTNASQPFLISGEELTEESIRASAACYNKMEGSEDEVFALWDWVGDTTGSKEV